MGSVRPLFEILSDPWICQLFNLYCAMIRKSTAEGKALKEVVFERSLRLILLFASLPYGVVGVLLGQIFGATGAFAYRSYRLKHFFCEFSRLFTGDLLAISNYNGGIYTLQ